MSIDVEGTVSAAGHGRKAGAAARRIVICALAATGILATNIFLPSLPVIAADLHVSSAAVTSAFTIFLAIFAIGQLNAGPLSDRFGRRMPILIGLGIFIAGTIWCAFARDLSSLLIGDQCRLAAHVRLRCFHVRSPGICSMARHLQRSWRRSQWQPRPPQAFHRCWGVCSIYSLAGARNLPLSRPSRSAWLWPMRPSSAKPMTARVVPEPAQN